MLCPVCKTEYGVSDYCPECGFDDFRYEFLNKAEASLWYDSIVMPYFEEYCLRFSCQTKGRRLYRYIGIGNYDVVKIPNGIESIGKYAFRNCNGIKEIILPNTIKVIQRYAFARQRQLCQLSIPKSVEEIEENAFDDLDISISLEDGSCFHSDGHYLIDKRNDKLLWVAPKHSIPSDEPIKIIGRCSLDNIEIPQNGILNIPEGVEEIAGVIIGPFSQRRKVKAIELPQTLIRLGKNALSGLNVEDIILPRNLSYIGDFAFAGTKIKEIYVPENVSVLGKNIVGNCKNLESIAVSENNSTYYSLNNCIVDRGRCAVVASCKTSTIPTVQSITEISEFAFWRFNGEYVIIPQNINRISEYAFDGTGDLSVLVDANNLRYFSDKNCIIERAGNGKIIFGNDLSEIPRYVDSIATGAFSNRDKSIIIPNNIITVGANVFSLMNQGSDDEGNIYRWGYVFCETIDKPDGWAEDWTGESEAIVLWKNDWFLDGETPCPN